MTINQLYISHLIANERKNVAEQRTVAIDASSTGQGTVSEPESDLKQEIIKLRRRIEEKDKQIEEKDKQIAALQASQKAKDIPQSVDHKMGPIKVQNLSRIGKDDIRGLQGFAIRNEELIRRKIKEVGHASTKFYAIDKFMDVEYLVPVVFTVDMRGRTIEMELDESRFRLD